MAESLQIKELQRELKALRNSSTGKAVPDPRTTQRIAELESEIGRRSMGVVTTPGMAKGGSVIKKSGSKAAKAGVTKFSPVKTKKLAEGGMAKKKSTVNAAGNYTKPELRKKIVSQVKSAATQGTGAGEWSARKAQLVAKKYKAAGGGYK